MRSHTPRIAFASSLRMAPLAGSITTSVTDGELLIIMVGPEGFEPPTKGL